MRFFDVTFLGKKRLDSITIPNQRKRLAFMHLLTRGIMCVSNMIKMQK